MAIIGFDASYLSVSGKGVSRYQHNLIKGLAKLDRQNCYYIFLNKKNIIPDLPQQDNFHYVRISIPNRIFWDQFQLPGLLKKYKFDLYHTTSDTLPLSAKTKFALFLFEIPDYRMRLMLQSGYNSLYAKISYKYNKFLLPLALKKAAIIMASSQSTKTDLIKKYKVKEGKILVVYPGVDTQFCPAMDEWELRNTRKKYGAENGYIFHISSADPRDNTPVVLRAYAKAIQKLAIVKKLIIFGDAGFQRPKLMGIIEKLNLKNNVVFTGRLPEEELIALYRAADLYVDPSLYEGFGFQVAEAMSCGIPVIASNVTSLPEIINNAGILVPAADIDNLALAITKILNDSELCQALRQKGIERAKYFSWDNTAQMTLSIYNTLL